VQARGFFVQRHRPITSAWHVRAWPSHFFRLLFALLGCGAVALYPRAILAQSADAPLFETVVLAAPIAAETPREDSAASCSVITQDRTPRAAESVPQVLSEQAGAVVTRLGGMGSTATVSLRGSTANQVLIYVDGVPFNTATGGGVDLGAIPIGDVERIEIYRGMSPIGFGASAIGGVVSITTAMPKDNRADVEAGGGSFGTYFGGARASWNRGRFHLYSGLHALTSDGDFPYVNTQGLTLPTSDGKVVRRRNNDLRQFDGTMRTVLDLPGDRRLSTSILFFDRTQGLPFVASLANPTARLGTVRTTGILAYESNQDLGPGGRLRAMAYGNYDLTHFEDLDHQIVASRTDTRDRTYTLGGTLDWRRVTRPWLALSGVFDARFDRFRPSDAVSSGAPATRLFGATGVESDFWMQPIRFDVIASLRLEAAREETSGRDYFDRFLPTSGPVKHVLPIARLSLVKEVAGWLTLRANGGRYARLPSTIELYGNTGYLLDNPALRPEKGFNADAGPVVSWQRGTNRIRWSTSLFASLVSDLIQYQYLGGRARADNLGSARILGVESEATLEFVRHARVVAAGTFTDARDTSPAEAQNGKQLPLRPRYRFYARPEWRAVQIGTHVALGFYAELDTTAGNYRNVTNMDRVAARFLIGAGAYAELPGHFSLRISGQNLGNSPINDFANFPLPGREIYLTIAWSSADNKPKE
jgi:outer membrane receptor protein involved in Fe transport